MATEAHPDAGAVERAAATAERIGKRTLEGVEELGLGGWLLGRSVYYLGLGHRAASPSACAPPSTR